MKILIGAVIAFSVATFVLPTQLCEGFFPQNDLSFPVDSKAANVLKKEEVDKIIDDLIEVYSPIFSERNLKLSINNSWDQDQVNAYTTLSRGQAVVVISGGLTRHPSMTTDGIASVLCHEFGHHLAGKPKYTRFFFSVWPSVEGQCDYFATLKCMRRYYDHVDPYFEVNMSEVPVSVTTNCDSSFSDERDRQVCYRSSLVAQTMGDVLKTMRNDDASKVSHDTPDSKVVSSIYASHPNAQCRLDTYYAGALCDKDVSDEITKSDVNSGQCARKDGYNTGVRPQCWFVPKS